MRPQAGQAGFSLIEVLVAFAILALALGILLSLLATGLRNTAVAHDYGQALVLAEGRMAEMQALEFARVTPAVSSGMFAERYAWRSEVRQLDDAATDVTGVALYALNVEVQWPAGRQPRRIVLASVRLGRAP